jgi:hypothetical protein
VGEQEPLTRVAESGLWRSLVSALDWGSRGREFKSPQPDAVNMQVRLGTDAGTGIGSKPDQPDRYAH